MAAVGVARAAGTHAGRGTRALFSRWRVLLRFVVPAFLVFVLWDAVPSAWEALHGLF